MTSSGMKRRAFALAARTMAAVVSAVAFVGVASATTLSLPAPNLYQPTAFGDAQVYSLELLNLIENNNKLSQQSQFNVTAAEGQIKDLIVIGTGAKGTSSTNTAGVADDAYLTPSGSNEFFSTRNSEPTNGPAGDLENSWEVSIASLITYLTDPATLQTYNLVFLVDSNQEGNLEGQTQFFWARIQGVDADGNNTGTRRSPETTSRTPVTSACPRQPANPTPLPALPATSGRCPTISGPTIPSLPSTSPS
jgi:hypothetical protein